MHAIKISRFTHRFTQSDSSMKQELSWVCKFSYSLHLNVSLQWSSQHVSMASSFYYSAVTLGNRHVAHSCENKVSLFSNDARFPNHTHCQFTNQLSYLLLGQKVCPANNVKFLLCIYYKLYFSHLEVVLSAIIMPETSFILCFVVPDINRNMKI